jgi:hypothetical protein
LSCITILCFWSRATSADGLWLRLALLIVQPVACLGLPLWWFLRSHRTRATSTAGE